jgi:2-keto-3-deoxy-L-rhamnonate aldolase RhmA
MTASAQRASRFLARLRAGEPTLMLGIRASRTPDIVRIAHAAGHHGVIVDLEHSTISLDIAGSMCATANDLGLTPFVRLPEREYGAIGRLLDAGAQGIIAPRVETADEASVAARACRFPPNGQRSAIAAVPQVGMRPTPPRELYPRLDDATIVQILVETPAGIANADEIARIDGVDMLAVGVNDLTAELGVPGEHRDPRVRQAIASVADASQRHGKLLMLGGITDLSLMTRVGACPLCITGMDTELVFSAARDRVAHVLASQANRVGSPNAKDPA